MNMTECSSFRNKKAERRNMSVDDLVIPVKYYQREAPSKKKIEFMAENWNWVLYEPIKVSQIKGGGKGRVVDGGNRLRAAWLNGSMKTLPCDVHVFDSVQDEAKAFLGLQQGRTRIKSYENHRASLCAKDSSAILLDKIVKDAGYEVRNGRTGDFVFDAVSTLTKLITSDKDIASKAFDVCAEIAGGGRIYNHVLNGVFEVEYRGQNQLNRTILTDQNIEKLKKEGMINLVREINKVKAIVGTGSSGFGRKIPAKGILNVLNKGRRTGKIRLSFDDEVVL